ncbi:VOC family protein [Paenibacillus sp. LHD-38]|uniref:VOC family protein n=1 Tax=Paenibacillus sp. LHD-38 TaxID=3072143 RepID=UPI00280E34CD|nr:VOC family protein [Paenibacillus sp. LHD-38]MDQ8737741.1 VOC family protein [Paenibacillus sp. LHD-38]
MSLEVYLNFNGNCREAANYYAQVFGSEVTHFTTFGDMPQHPEYVLPEEAKNLVMHARVNIMGSTVMFSDVFPGMPFIEGNNINLTVVSKDEDEVRVLFNKLADGGKIGMELQETFWSKCYGQLTDKFGIHWQCSHESGEVIA